jgi:simple sugar transport system ATP-binding protein
MDKPFVAMRGITKAFPNVVANDRIDFDIFKSEIHALLGENGAGKSTLMKILYGFYRADSGQILLEGKPLTIHSPHDARFARIGMVFQEFTLIPAFSVAENIALFLKELDVIVDWREISQRIEEMSERYGLEVDPDELVSELSIGEQQKVEILKLLLSDSRLLILDEPTRVLAPHEVDALFEILYSMRADGYAIILITHKIKEVLECADRITVLRNGRVSATLPRSDATENKLLETMFGKVLSGLKIGKLAIREKAASPILELKNVHTESEGAETKLVAINLDIYPGEIVGIAGVSGNGQRELGDVVLGMIKCSKGSKHLFSEDVTNSSIQDLRKSGVSYIPENPLTMAAAPFMSVLKNMAVPKTWHYDLYGGLALNWPAIKADVEKSMESLGFEFPLDVQAKSLSGGNLQRMVIVREFTHTPRLIIASYITRGLDVQSTIAARQALIHARDNGAGVLLISEDLEELFNLSDRLIVLYGGKIVGVFKPNETDFYEVGHLMTGSGVQNGANQ